ncbi:MAG: LPS export ABC transporter permease LptF [Thermoanaerobaculia bacterium]|nr:LPS export ABC transporter permease LptF [Thermoanaerobaculia bacterium]
MRILDRYLLKEISGPLALGFLGYTFIMLMQFLFRSAEMIIRRGVPAETVGEMLVLTLPNTVVLSIPMALLFAILVAVGQLSSTSELTAMRASGVSLLKLYRPILLLSLILATLNCALMLTALPWGNTRLQQLLIEVVRNSAARQIEPRVFYEEWEGLTIYVFEVTPEGRWNGVFVADTALGKENDITVAEWGEVRADRESGQLVLELANARVHRVNILKPAQYEVFEYRSLERVLEGLPPSYSSSMRSLRDLRLGELAAVIRDPDVHAERANLARVEIHKKFAIPGACVVFALLALPLGFTQQRGGRASGFAISIAVILLYYVLLNNGEEAARLGKMSPWFAMWRPNLLFFAIGLVLLVRRNRDRSHLLGRLYGAAVDGFTRLTARLRSRRRSQPEGSTEGTGRLRGVVPRRRRRPSAAAREVDLVVKLPRPRVRFPGLLDRYIIRTFFKVLILAVLSALALKLVADFTERLDDMLENQVATEIVVDYYKYKSIDVGFQLSPVAVLITTLVVFGLLSRSNELIAAKSLGFSLYRLSAPILVAALLVSGLAAFVQARVLPVTNEKVARLDDVLRGRETPRSYRRADRNWLFGRGRFIYNYLHYDSRSATLHRLQVLEFDASHRLARRLFAERATYVDRQWRVVNAWIRRFDGVEPQYRALPGPVLADYPETPEYFESEYKLPNAMTYDELSAYISEVRASGQAVPELEVELHNKIGYPVTNLVMALLALPFSFRLGRRGALYGMGIGVVLGIVFLGIYAFSRTLGEVGALPPPLSIWAPSLLFGVLSVYLFLGVET